jgi:predicted RNA polymerase sigma factor
MLPSPGALWQSDSEQLAAWSPNPPCVRISSESLLALLCFHAARLPGRMDDDGGLIQLEIQDRSKWDRDLMGRGFHFVEKSSMGNELSEYHLEAGIASLHCAAPTSEKTEWAKILELYDMLYRLKPSPLETNFFELKLKACRLRAAQIKDR